MQRFLRLQDLVQGMVCLGAMLVSCGPGEKGTPRASLGTEETFEAELQAPTWSRDIAALVQSRCFPCHAEGGEAPLSFGTYVDARRRAGLMLKAVDTGFMPPWLAQRGVGSFLGERFLEAGDRDLLAHWIEAGQPEGEPGHLLPSLLEQGWPLGEPDLVLRQAEPFVIPASGPDVKRGFPLPHSEKETRYVRAVDIRFPGGYGAHHCKLLLDDSGVAEDLFKQSGGGFVVMQLMQQALEHGGSADLLTGWFPGVDPTIFPKDAAVRLDPGDCFVIDLHGVPRGVETKLRPEVAIYFSEVEPTTQFLVISLSLGLLNILPGQEQTYSRSVELPVDMQLIGIVPHAHFVCKEVRVGLSTPERAHEPLLEIRNWDFDFQFMYSLREPRAVSAGARLEFSMLYDNTDENPSNPNSPPRRVLLGPENDNEMGALFLQVTVENAAEREHLLAAVKDWDDQLARDNQAAALYTSLARSFDADADGTLDASEDAQATEFLRKAIENPQWMQKALDQGTDSEQILAVWEGRASSVLRGTPGRH